MPDEGKISRRDEFERDNHTVIMPDCEAFYLIEYLFELGLTLGDQAITHSEIRAWMENTGIDLSAWESRSIKNLSSAYLSGSHEYRAADSDSPWEAAPYYMSAKYRKAMKLKMSIRKAAEA